MNNQELKIKFEENKIEIERARANNKDIRPLLEVKYNLLKTGFERLREQTSDEKYNTNPNKYSTLLSYLNTMKKVADEINLEQDEILAFENEIKNEMAKNGLDWLLGG